MKPDIDWKIPVEPWVGVGGVAWVTVVLGPAAYRPRKWGAGCEAKAMPAKLSQGKSVI